MVFFILFRTDCCRKNLISWFENCLHFNTHIFVIFMVLLVHWKQHFKKIYNEIKDFLLKMSHLRWVQWFQLEMRTLEIYKQKNWLRNYESFIYWNIWSPAVKKLQMTSLKLSVLFQMIWEYSRRRNIDRPNIDRFWDFSRNFLKINFYLLNKI